MISYCFAKNGFSPDAFLQDLWNDVPLEVLHDDLGSYLKVLRSAMIELINRDYVDFVNLSGNLVGLDKAISNLQEPLSVIHSEIVVSNFSRLLFPLFSHTLHIVVISLHTNLGCGESLK